MESAVETCFAKRIEEQIARRNRQEVHAFKGLVQSGARWQREVTELQKRVNVLERTRICQSDTLIEICVDSNLRRTELAGGVGLHAGPHGLDIGYLPVTPASWCRASLVQQEENEALKLAAANNEELAKLGLEAKAATELANKVQRELADSYKVLRLY
eukprot:1175607-Prorocentrum_minimum.AAC.3